MSRKAILWVLCVPGTLIATGVVAVWMVVGGDRGLLPVGATTDAHHQIEMACETCHAASVFADAATAEKALNKTCRNCHEDELKTADDSHPRGKFRDPRMAVYWQKLDARLCTTCHVEHRPEITRAGAVTVAMDFCAACHAEGDQDVRAARPSHSGLTFETCASAGCHNYHDNRALYEDFLVKNAGHPWLAPAPTHALSARHRSWRPPEDAALRRSDAVAPSAALADSTALDRWAGSGHAAAGVNCAGCHAPAVAEGASRAAVEAQWIEVPNTGVCKDCHKVEAKTFARGRHGMRGHPSVAAPRDPERRLEAIGLGGAPAKAVATWFADPPRSMRMTVAEARLPMRANAVRESLDCGTCHRPHAVDTGEAAVQACASCHDDPHSRAYFGGAHHALWRRELAGEAPPGTGVSCATCHMIKIERRGKIATSHNQNDNLRPNEKMIRSVCLDCHGLGFTIDALADADLVAGNFNRRPAVHIESIEWAAQRAAAKRDADH